MHVLSCRSKPHRQVIQQLRQARIAELERQASVQASNAAPSVCEKVAFSELRPKLKKRGAVICGLMAAEDCMVGERPAPRVRAGCQDLPPSHTDDRACVCDALAHVCVWASVGCTTCTRARL
jgi:hypothetical protein